jgi:transposase
MEAYSLDLRQRVLAAVDAGQLRRPQIAALFAVSTSWIRRLVQRRRETGSIAPKPQRHGPLPALTDRQRQRLADLVRRHPDATLAELRRRLGVGVGITTLWRAVAQLGLTLKKSRSGPASRTAPTSANGASSSRRTSGGSSRVGSSSWTRPGPARP